MKKYVVILALLTIQQLVFAQTVNVHFKNGQVIEYPSDNIDYVNFSAKPTPPSLMTGQVVDLGLSVYWASCNLGAEKPEEYGEYYAWGETTPKEKYEEDNYSFYNSDNDEIISIGYNISGTEYDAAHVTLGGGWRMPVTKEFQELIDKCQWEWAEVNGVKGFTATGPNGNSIFFPAAGYKATKEYGKMEMLRYWIAEQKTDLLASAFTKYNGKPYLESILNYKYYGYTIRPVTENSEETGEVIDHTNDYLVTDKISASCTPVTVNILNGYIQAGSILKMTLFNGSSEKIELTNIQLIDRTTLIEQDYRLPSRTIIEAGDSPSYNIQLNSIMFTPVACFTYLYNKKKYTVEVYFSDSY